MSQIIPLHALQENESGRIIDIDGSEGWKHRLEELGLCEGVEIRLIQSGEPCIIGLNEKRLSLRMDHSITVLVELIET